MVRKVLFVDDDQIMLLAIEKRFSTYSDYFSMVMANDGFEAVQKLKDTSVSLIVLDLKMPRMDGMSLLTHTRDKYPDIPVIIVSGYRTAEMYKLAKAKGVIAYISKPFQVDDLGKIIMSTLQKEADGGIMHKVSPTVFLQLMEMEGKTCTIRVLDHSTKQGGILYFTNGQLLDARIGSLKGINAAYKVFTWEEVTIFIQNECVEMENKINSDLQPIIMRAVSMKDEELEMVEEESEAELLAAQQSSPEFGELDDLDGLANSVDSSESDDDLSDLELPDEFFTEAEEEHIGSQVEDISAAVTGAPPQNQLSALHELIIKEVGSNSGLQDIYHDPNLGNVVEFITELGAMFDFGSLKAAYIDSGTETDKIILPGQPATVIKVNQKCPQDKMMQVLSQYS